ncbi:MAG TPA: hypothetical protein VEN81_10065 [Planctomycetota bacterium]|nr:hypothetical protein [Planctomycetota bacterium]
MSRWIAVALACLAVAAGGPQERKNRPFYMGVGLMPHDLSVEGMAALFAFLNTNADLVPLSQDKGVPWPEALEKRAYSPEYEKKLTDDQEQFKERKLLLMATPLNGEKNGLAGYRGAAENEPLEGAWRAKDFDDPAVSKAYFAYCSDLIRRFHPEFFGYALEVNQLAKNNPTRWKKFVPFATDLYGALKKENPKLTIFVTLNGDTYLEDPGAQKKAVKEILAASDLVAVQTLPYIKEPVPSKLGRDFLAQFQALAPSKPFALATGFLAEDLSVIGIERVGKAAWQMEYLKFVFEECSKLNAKFVIWMIPRDLDLLVQKLGLLGEVAKPIRNTGLLDAQGNPRKSMELWQTWFKLPRK